MDNSSSLSPGIHIFIVVPDYIFIHTFPMHFLKQFEKLQSTTKVHCFKLLMIDKGVNCNRTKWWSSKNNS